MANYLKNEKTDAAGNVAGQQPIVLARLPRVVDSQPSPDGPAADQTLPPPEVMPQLNLRSEIERRTRLDIATAHGEDYASSVTHFVDSQHAPRLEQSVASQPDESVELRATNTKPTSLGESLFQLHSQLAPHAGLIVALALIASAGLLYWMIVGPTNALVPNYQTPGYEIHSEGFGATSNYRPEATEPDFSADVRPATEPTSSLDQWNRMTFPDLPQQVAVPEIMALPKAPTAAVPLSEMSTAAPRESSPPVEVQFPATSHPQALDFGALQGNSPTAVPRSLPEVAERRSETTHR